MVHTQVFLGSQGARTQAQFSHLCLLQLCPTSMTYLAPTSSLPSGRLPDGTCPPWLIPYCSLLILSLCTEFKSVAQLSVCIWGSEQLLCKLVRGRGLSSLVYHNGRRYRIGNQEPRFQVYPPHWPAVWPQRNCSTIRSLFSAKWKWNDAVPDLLGHIVPVGSRCSTTRKLHLPTGPTMPEHCELKEDLFPFKIKSDM